VRAPRSPAVLLALVAALGTLAAGCGGGSSAKPVPGAPAHSASASTSANANAPEVNPAGDIPDNQAYVRYRPPGASFSLVVPEGWSRSAATADGPVTFTDKLNAIRVEMSAAARPLTAAQATSIELPRLAARVKGFHAGTVSAVSRGAGTAIRIAYVADGAPDPVTGKVVREAVERYVFFHGGRQVVLTLSAPRGADNVDPWRIVTSSLRWSR
jgi:hypothetical protein